MDPRAVHQNPDLSPARSETRALSQDRLMASTKKGHGQRHRKYHVHSHQPGAGRGRWAGGAWGHGKKAGPGLSRSQQLMPVTEPLEFAALILSQGQLCPWGHQMISAVGEVGVAGLWRVEARDAGKALECCRWPCKDCLTPTLISATMESSVPRKHVSIRKPTGPRVPCKCLIINQRLSEFTRQSPSLWDVVRGRTGVYPSTVVLGSVCEGVKG